jgi:hypothetical protein
MDGFQARIPALPAARPFTLAELIHALPIDDPPRRLGHATTQLEGKP